MAAKPTEGGSSSRGDGEEDVRRAGVYRDGKLVALVCDDQLFVKITAAGRAFLGDAAEEAPAYLGAKPSFRVDAERWDDAEWMGELVRVTWGELGVGK